MEVASPGPTDLPQEATTERVSTGFEGLDQMLGGGLFRGSSTLITGAPGTSKTTLAGLFTESACRAGAHTVRQLRRGRRARPAQSQVGRHSPGRAPEIRRAADVFGPHRCGEPEEHLLRISAQIAAHRPRCVVIDPLSAISRTEHSAPRAPSVTVSSTSCVITTSRR